MGALINEIITLPTGKKAFAIELKNLEEMTVDFFKSKDLSKTDRYVCIMICEEDIDWQKVFVMAVKQELHKKEVIEELKQDLEFQIEVLKQL